MNFISPQPTRGFTLIELLIFLAVFVLLVSVFWESLSGYRDRQLLSTGAETVMSALSEARAQTVSSDGDRQFGVYLDSVRAVIFPGTVFSEPNQANREFKLENGVMISSINLAASPNTVVFRKITGETANYGTITLSLERDPTKTKIISVSKTGGVSQQ